MLLLVMLLRQKEMGPGFNGSKETKDWLGFTHQTLQAVCAQPQLQTDYFFPPASKRSVLTTLSL